MDRIRNNLPFQDANGRFSARTMFSYIFDYAIIIVFAVIYAALDKLVQPFAQPFSLNDIRLQYPMADPERIPIAEAVTISAGFPLVVIIIYTQLIDGIYSHSLQKGLKRYTFKQRLWELNCGILGLFLAQAAAFCITGTLKNLVGRPRPDVIARCIVDPEKVAALANYTLATKEICTRPAGAIMQDAFRSFPSGHSSSSFAGLGYLSLYLAGKLHVLDQRGEVWRTVIIIIPLLAASCIAASRIMDARHHPTDVFIGSALGVLCAWAAYRQYFPPLNHVWMKGRAYPMREWGVKLRRPDDIHGTGYSSGVAGQQGEAGLQHGPTGELPYFSTNNTYPARGQESYQLQGLEPMRTQPRADPSPSGFEMVGEADDTDYEVVRARAGLNPPSEAVSRQGTGNQNVFRDQVNMNQSRRRHSMHSEDEAEDMGTGHHRPLVGSGNV